jgi:hypothetical protein
MVTTDTKEKIKNLFPRLRTLEFILDKEPVTVKDLEEYFPRSTSTYYRWFQEWINSGLVEKIKDNKKPKLKKHAQYIYRSTPKLKLTLNIIFHWIANLILKDNKVELSDPINFEFQNEIISFFSDIVFPELKDWIAANWGEYTDSLSFFRDFTDRVLQITQLRLENIIFKKIAERYNHPSKISEGI